MFWVRDVISKPLLPRELCVMRQVNLHFKSIVPIVYTHIRHSSLKKKNKKTQTNKNNKACDEIKISYIWAEEIPLCCFIWWSGSNLCFRKHCNNENENPILNFSETSICPAGEAVSQISCDQRIIPWFRN